MTKLPQAHQPTEVTLTATKPKRRWWRSLNKFLLLVLVVTMVFEALITNDQATNGRKMAALQVESDQLELQTQDLERQISQISSLTYIRQYATNKLGLQPVTTNVMYLTAPTPTEGSK